MKKILDGASRRVGAILNEVDVNFIEVCNALLRIAYPTYTLKGYAETEPVAPAEGDCYLVTETATVWGEAVEKNEILAWVSAAWLLLPHKITEISAAIQSVDSHIERGKFAYHDQDQAADTAGDWRTFADANGFYTQYCTVGNATKGAGTWVTKFTVEI